MRYALGAGHQLQLREGGKRLLRGRFHTCFQRVLRELAAQHHADVAVVRKHHVRTREQVVQDAARIALPALPQLGPVVAVKRHLHPGRARGAGGGERGLGHIGAQRRADPGQVQPLRTVKQARPVVGIGRRQRKRRIGAVVHHLAGPVDRTGGEEVQPHAAIHPPHVAGIDGVPAQLAQHRRA